MQTWKTKIISFLPLEDLVEYLVQYNVQWLQRRLYSTWEQLEIHRSHATAAALLTFEYMIHDATEGGLGNRHPTRVINIPEPSLHLQL